MKYTRFGKTELEMPVLSCGGMRYQQGWEDIPFEEIKKEGQENLEATIKAAFDHGITHIETARGYGSSEVQLGYALKILPRDEIIVQTKVPPKEDPKEFLATLETSFANLQMDYIDLVALHGINNEKNLSWSPPCLDILEQYKRDGKIGHIGFSTHATCDVIEAAINTGRFEYVNLHCYYIFQENLPALKLAKEYDMGTFIISPSDKGGKLYDPPDIFRELTAPLTPMQFNDCFCLSNEYIDTISIGASKPSDFNEHVEIVEKLGENDSEIAKIAAKLDAQKEKVMGKEWVGNCLKNLPDWKEVPDEMNIHMILHLYNLAKGLDLVEYGKMRYNFLGEGDEWFPGNKSGNVAKFAKQITELLESRGPQYAEKIPGILAEAHELMNVEKEK
jgi:predicted aldo/keto reductase-like oxidoreductase